MIVSTKKALRALHGIGLGDLSAAQEAFAQAAIAKMRADYAAGAVKIGIMGSGAFLPDDSSIAAVNKAYADLKAIIDKWATTYLDWARAGRKATTGSAYSLDDWAKFGSDVLSSAISAQTGYAADSSYLLNAPSSAASAAKATASTLANPLAWPWWLQAGAGVVALLGAAYVYRAFKK